MHKHVGLRTSTQSPVCQILVELRNFLSGLGPLPFYLLLAARAQLDNGPGIRLFQAAGVWSRDTEPCC